MPASAPTFPTSPDKLKVLVVGSGAREHALVKACLRSPLVCATICAPGNGGISAEVPTFPIKADNVPALVALAVKEAVDFVIVGPEVPLSLGLVDALAAAQIRAFGPNRLAARLEASKAFTKSFLLRHKIPTAYGEIFDTSHAAIDYLARKSPPYVVKASGLAAGKGVTVAQTRGEAEAAVRAALEQNAFGTSGDELLIEDFLPGEEASLMALVSGQNYFLLPAAQDHKRIGDADTGPNTGGMGAYAPAAIVSPEILQRVEAEIVRPTLAALLKEGIHFSGVLYIGLMLTPNGPSVVEFNVRFGDPECQVLLPLLDSDPIQLLWDIARSQLNPATTRLNNNFAASVVLSSHNYPAAPRLGDAINLPDHAALPANVAILHAGTARQPDGVLVTSGGRVLAVTATAPSLKAALDAAYAACARIHFDGMHYRTDIGARQLHRV